MAATLTATLHPNQGDIKLNLFPNHAPKTVRNFVGLADGTQEWRDPKTNSAGTGPIYGGVVFHRVIQGFMLQGGDPLGTGMGGPGYKFTDEFRNKTKASGYLKDLLATWCCCARGITTALHQYEYTIDYAASGKPTIRLKAHKHTPVA